MTVEAMTIEAAIRELRAHFRRKAQHPHDCICACCEAIEVLAETELKLRKALIEHRADLHGWSSRPCPTCRESAEVLGIAGMVPGCCARGDTDRDALNRRGPIE